MTDLARFTALPELRCFQQLPDPARPVCGAPATRQRLSSVGGPSQFFCGEHARTTDMPIAGAVVLRRVSFTVDVLFAGTSLIPAAARAEALARLERAIADAGGIINLHTANDVVGRYEPPAPARRELRVGGRG